MQQACLHAGRVYHACGTRRLRVCNARAGCAHGLIYTQLHTCTHRLHLPKELRAPSTRDTRREMLSVPLCMRRGKIPTAKCSARSLSPLGEKKGMIPLLTTGCWTPARTSEATTALQGAKSGQGPSMEQPAPSLVGFLRGIHPFFACQLREAPFRRCLSSVRNATSGSKKILGFLSFCTELCTNTCDSRRTTCAYFL